MADGTSRIKTFITLVLFIAVRLEAVAGQPCPVTDDRCVCRNNFDDIEIKCEGLGNQERVPPFLDSVDTYSSLTITTDTTIRVVQDNAFANIGVRNLILSNLQIKSVAENAFRGKIETVLESLNLDGNDIANIPPGTFQNLTNLKLLSVTTNKIAALSPETFRGLPSLTTVYLYLNELGSLPDGLFSDCAALNLLLLNGNKLSRLSAMSFGRLSALQELQLQDNRIDSIEPGTFQLLSRLTILNLKSNAIQTVNASTLIGLQNLISLDLSNNNISIVPVDTFQQLQALKTLNLANNQIQTIEVETFSNLRNLENLDLSGNDLMSIPEYLFSNLSKLQKLSLTMNDIHFVNARTFHGLISLSTLQMNNNSVQELSVDLFQNTGTLTYLDLSGNSIHSIVPGTFDNCSKLVNIYLRDNKLDSIRPRTFYGLTALQQLYLDHNDISYLGSATFSNLPKVTYIDLSFNNITGMDEKAFVNISSLKTLLLDRNRLASVPVDALKWLPNLSTLSLKWNGIVSIADNTFSGLRYLKRLELAYNSLEFLETKAFAGLANLTTLLLQNNSICYTQPGLFGSFLNGSLGTLDLSSNCITDMSGALFSALGKLTALSLSENNLTEISGDSFLGLNSVTDIELDFNTISVIDPFAFSNLNALGKLSMFGNRISPETLIAISNLPKLKTLELGQNLIDVLPEDSFANCSSLSDLGLRNNSLRRIGIIDSVNTVIEKLDLGLNRLNTSEGIADLAQFMTLRTLKLDGNGFDDALLGNATLIFQQNAITELDLSSNNLSSAVFSIIGSLTSLSTLRIDNNQIESLGQEGSLSSLAKTVSILSAKNNLLTGSSLSPLANFTALNYLNLDGNQIENIPSGLFRSMFNLGTLSLNRNLLTEIRNDTLGELKSTISEIYLADNQIELVETGAMLAITGIKQLDLSGNRLTTITLPESMPALLNLVLARNRLESFPLGLRSFRLLNSIDLSENRIRVLPPISIYSTVQMRLLDFSNNQIENIDGMTYIGVIDRLNFSGNHLSDVQTFIFRRVTSANHVDFSSNRFERVPEAISASHATATVIDLALDFNNISNLSDWAGNGSLQSRIERMSLRGNRIAAIPTAVIESLNSSLIELDVRDNQLVSLEESTFANTVHLTKLDLEGNPLQCDCPLGWLRRLQLTVDVGLATCVTPEWFRGQLAVCYNISTCDGIDPALKTIDLNDTCFMWNASSVPQLFSTTLPTSTANTSEISTVTTANRTVTTANWTVTPVNWTVTPVNWTVTPVNWTVTTANRTVTPVNWTVTPVNWTVTPVNWTVTTNQFTPFVFSSVPTDVHNATPIVQESSLPYNRDGLIAGLVCGGFALIVIIGCAAYWIKHRMAKKAQHVSTISNGMLYNNPGFSKI